MTWRQWAHARRLLAEEFIWAPRRQAEAEEKAAEDAKYKAARATARP